MASFRAFATDFGNLQYRARFRPLDGSHVWRILLEREVSSSAVVIREVAGQDAAQVLLVENEDIPSEGGPSGSSSPSRCGGRTASPSSTLRAACVRCPSNGPISFPRTRISASGVGAHTSASKTCWCWPRWCPPGPRHDADRSPAVSVGFRPLCHMYSVPARAAGRRTCPAGVADIPRNLGWFGANLLANVTALGT